MKAAVRTKPERSFWLARGTALALVIVFASYVFLELDTLTGATYFLMVVAGLFAIVHGWQRPQLAGKIFLLLAPVYFTLIYHQLLSVNVFLTSLTLAGIGLFLMLEKSRLISIARKRSALRLFRFGGRRHVVK